MTPEAEWKMMRAALLREMDKDIFTVASPGRIRVDQEDLDAAQDVLAGSDSIQEDFAPIFMDYGHYGSDTDGPPDHDTLSWSPLDDVEEDPDENLLPSYVSRKRTKESKQLKEYMGGMSGSSVRAMPEYKQFLNFVLGRDIPGIHPEDVMARWRRMFPDVKLTSGQIEQLHAALADDGALDKPVYYESKKAKGAVDSASKFPFKQAQLSENKMLRKFSRDVNDQELTWHRDREDRVVRMVEGKGWHLQLDGKLPQPMRLGETYEIPAGSWHRLVRLAGATNLTVIVEKVKKGDRVKHKGKEATVKVPDARGPLVGIDPDGPKDMEMVPDDEIKPVKEAKKKGLWANVHAKRKRGGKPAKPGDKNYPDEKSLKSAQGKS